MNERIRELAEQCEGVTICECGSTGFNYERFAELIIWECLNNMNNEDGDLDFAIWKTKNDFGIE